MTWGTTRRKSGAAARLMLALTAQSRTLNVHRKDITHLCVSEGESVKVAVWLCEMPKVAVSEGESVKVAV